MWAARPHFSGLRSAWPVWVAQLTTLIGPPASFTVVLGWGAHVGGRGFEWQEQKWDPEGMDEPALASSEQLPAHVEPTDVSMDPLNV